MTDLIVKENNLSMIELKIDDEFKDFMPPLPKEKRAQLEENILQFGIQDPFKTWQGILIDGHNRYEIAKAHGLDFATTEMHFNSRDDVKLWIVKNQFGRRDLTAYELSVLALKIKPIIAKLAKENQKLSDGRGQKGCQISDNLNVDTKKEIAKAAGVSHDTIAKVEKIEKQAAPEIKAAVTSSLTTYLAISGENRPSWREKTAKKICKAQFSNTLTKSIFLKHIILLDYMCLR